MEKEIKAKSTCFSGLSIPELQRYVRASFLSVPICRQTEAMKFLQASVVVPIIQVHGQAARQGSLSLQNLERVEKLAHAITEGKPSNISETDLRLGCYVASGALSAHPFIQGLLIAIVEKLKRAERGVTSFKGLKLSPHEATLVSEAGVALSMAACNRRLLQEFGLLHVKPKRDLAHITSYNPYPEPLSMINMIFLQGCKVGFLPINFCGVLPQNFAPVKSPCTFGHF